MDIQARLGNPSGGLNGGEVSHKLNREGLLLADQPAVYARLAAAFMWDWTRS